MIGANSGVSQLRQEAGTPEWGLTDVPDFVPQRFETVVCTGPIQRMDGVLSA